MPERTDPSRHSIRAHSRWLRRLVVALVCLVMIGTACVTAHADDAGSKSFDVLVELAVSSYSEGDYATALDAFTRAHAIEDSPELLYNMGRCAEMLGQFPLAIEHYTEFARSPGVEHEPRTDALERIAALQATLALDATAITTVGGAHGAGVDLNTATAAELQSLPGIGEVKAQAIVDERTANGPFASVDALTRVSGIGQGTVDKLRDHARVGGTSAQTASGTPAPAGPGVNINAATAGELQSLPGIGEVKAQAIVDERTANGPFASCAALTRVHGIGQKTVDKLLGQCRTE